MPFIIQGNTIVSYLKAGRLLHIITAIELTIFGAFYFFADIEALFSSTNIFLELFVLSPTVCMPLFAQLDARSRYQNYKLVKDRLYLYGFQPRIIRPFMKSRCQRDAVNAAACELGMSANCKTYFRNEGYKWYNLFPDVIFNDPGILLTKNFWMTTLFSKTYHSKINFENKPSAEATRIAA